MADVPDIVRQWLETEAAFGVSEMPVTRGRSASIEAPGEHTEPVAVRPVVAARPVAMPVATPAPVARPVAREGASYPARPAMTPVPSAAGGRDTFLPRDVSGRSAMARKSSVVIPPAPAGDIADLPPMTRQQKEAALAALLEEVKKASKPYINDISTKVVFGEGDPDAAIMFVGEGPGSEEDRTGRPFVGRSGQLLDKMIGAIGHKREQVFIGNVVKLRAADWLADGSRLQDRPPNPEEVARGIPFLHRQIQIIRPRVIVTLGAPAVKYLTGTTDGVMKIRGTWLSYRGIPVMPTYHPSFVLRAYTEENRRKVWEDLKKAAAKAKA
jgi:uracil-DNA glycosylase